MEMHRRLKGVGRSAPGSLSGVFDLRFNHNLHVGVRKAVCTVVQDQGWQMLQITMHEKKVQQFKPRRPSAEEVSNIAKLFFEDWETPVQVHRSTDDHHQGVKLWWSERVRMTTAHIPEF